MALKTQIIINALSSGNRLDKAIAESSGNLYSRSKIQKMFLQGQVYDENNNQVLDPKKPSYEGQIIFLENSTLENQTDTIKPKAIDLNIIYEDDDIIVINKQAGLTTHPGAGNYEDTLVNALVFYAKNLSSGSERMRPGIVHRLDRNTSGLMVVAKNDQSHAELSRMMQDREIKRCYLGIVLGMLKPPAGTIDKSIARSNKDRKKMGVVQIGGKRAITHYETIEIYKNGAASLVKFVLETGRTHQIRVHTSHLGNPIISDPEYGNARKFRYEQLGKEAYEQTKTLNRQALHAYQLSFFHPLTKKKLEFEASLPDDISALINLLKK